MPASDSDDALLTHADRILESMPLGYICWDASWRCTGVNAEGLRLIGYSRTEVLGRHYWELFPYMVGTDLETAYHHVAEIGVAETVESFYPEPLNRWFDTRVTREANGVSTFFLDTTARHAARDQLASLAEVAMSLTSTRSVEELERIVVGRGVTVFGADGGAVISAAGDGSWRVTANEAFGDHVQVTYGSLPYDSPLPACWTARTGQRLLLPTRAAGLAFHPSMAGVYAATKRDGWAFVPLTVEGERLGSLAVSWVGEHALSPAELEVLDGFAAQCAQTVHRIRAAQAERDAARQVLQLAETLQQALLTAPPQPDHLEIVVRYRPAADGARVGGDWYDAFLQPDGATMLVIGDVSGHDAEAAARMGQLRGLLRAVAYTAEHSALPDTPAAILTRVEHAARGLDVGTLATTILARIERIPDEPGADRVLRWTNAGHLAPALLHPDGTVEFLETPPDLLLGVDADRPRHDHSRVLPTGSVVVLYTDGLIERREASLDEGLAALRAALTDLADVGLDELCDTVLARLAPHPGEDDIALIALRAGPES